VSGRRKKEETTRVSGRRKKEETSVRKKEEGRDECPEEGRRKTRVSGRRKKEETTYISNVKCGTRHSVGVGLRLLTLRLLRLLRLLRSLWYRTPYASFHLFATLEKH
jgi:hypothetical protein